MKALLLSLSTVYINHHRRAKVRTKTRAKIKLTTTALKPAAVCPCFLFVLSPISIQKKEEHYSFSYSLRLCMFAYYIYWGKHSTPTDLTSDLAKSEHGYIPEWEWVVKRTWGFSHLQCARLHTADSLIPELNNEIEKELTG